MQFQARKRVGKRRRPGQVLTELHYRLRTEGDTPSHRAAAVALGTFVGCLPVYGLHLPICVIAARLLGISRIVTYLAAHVNNPLTAPLLLYVEYNVGHRLLAGDWPGFALPEFGARTLLGLSLDILLGGAILGGVLALVLGWVAYDVGQRWKVSPLRKRLIEETSQRYMDQGILTWEFVRSKLRHDPIYMTLHDNAVPEHRGHLIDLGCGRGILLALLRTAQEIQRQRVRDDAESPLPLGELLLTGVERDPRHAAVAAAALGNSATIVVADLESYAPPPCTFAVLLDVLHYMPAESQQRLLGRVCAALTPGGQLLIREADTGPRWRYRMTHGAELACAWARLRWRQRFHFRSAEDWQRLLRSHGLTTTVVPMAAGTPFSNVLIDARRPAEAEAARSSSA